MRRSSPKKGISTRSKKKTATKATAKKKVAAKKTTKKTVKKTVKKPVAKKTVAKKPVAKKTVAKKTVAKKPAKKTTKKAVVKTTSRKLKKKKEVAKLEKEILGNVVLNNKPKSSDKGGLEQILFKIPTGVENPLIGTPKQVQKELDNLAKEMQKYPENDLIFNKIHLYMHGYLINVVLKKFPYIKGFQTVDIYQETLIALQSKAIPHFKKGKGMSFLNFAKMCIRRHLITLLNASKNRLRDQSMNRAISLDSSPIRDDDKSTFANIITDDSPSVDKVAENNESLSITKDSLMKQLSEFEQVVLGEYLSSSSYREISANVSAKVEKKCDTKSIDNALLRIRKKALHLKAMGRMEEIPIFML